MAIKPVSPIDREKLVPTDASIIVEFTAMPTQADVNGLVVFNGSSFQAGWTGSVINLVEGGKRMVLTPPSLFTVGQIVDVFVQETGGAHLSYRFQVGVAQITTSDNNSDPSITISSTDYYLGYIKEPGAMYVRFTDPLSPEIPLISATIVDAGYDPTLNKVVVLFVNNGKVYVTTASPGDGPNSILPPGEGQTPIKAVAFPFDSVSVGGAGSGISTKPVVGFPRPNTPVVINDNPRVVRLGRPPDQSEVYLCIGFIPFKSSINYSSARMLPFVALPEGADFVEFTDPAPTPRATYGAIAVYRQGQSTGLVYSALSSEDPTPTGGSNLEIDSGGAGLGLFFGSERFTPQKAGDFGDGISLGNFAGSGLDFFFGQTNTTPVKIAVPLDEVSLGNFAGSGIGFFFGR